MAMMTHTSRSPNVVEATMVAEKEEIYRLRYEVYIEEMDGAQRHGEADVTQRQFRDELDEHARHFYIRQDREIVGCVRVNLRRDGPWECEERFELEHFLPAHPNRVAMCSRLAIKPQLRGSAVVKQLVCVLFEYLCEHEINFTFLDCHPKLLPLYSRLGFRTYKPGFKHPKYTYVIPMVLVMDDVQYLEKVNSPFVAIAKRYRHSTQWRHLLLTNFPAAAHTFISADVDVEAFWELLKSSLFSPAKDVDHPDILAGFSEAETKLLVSIGQVVSCRAGDALLGPGEQGREIFLILEGSFQEFGQVPLANKEQPIIVQIFIPGEILGEMGYLSHGRRSSTVVAMEDSTLLVLNAKSLDRILKTAPQLASKLFRNLARIVETKYYESLKS